MHHEIPDGQIVLGDDEPGRPLDPKRESWMSDRQWNRELRDVGTAQQQFHQQMTRRQEDQDTTEVLRIEVQNDQSYTPNSPVYGIAPQGFPMNPLQVNHLNELAQNPTYKTEDRMQAYELLQVLRLVAENTWPEDWDHTM
ncbi:hypothetical protein BDQ17DRAFT_1327394 [Cyathus striatus]|nr:hypothetical protein BDQ17DRAFT_1327394 [Cyathus striatus]